MDIDWHKWEAIEADQDRLNAAVDYHAERLRLADSDIRNVEVSIVHTLGSSGVFRRVDAGAWMRDFKANPQNFLAQYADHEIRHVLKQHLELTAIRQRAAQAHAKAIAARDAHSPSFFHLRNWIRTQQARGII